MYADAARLLVFGAFLTSVSCVKKYFFDATDGRLHLQSPESFLGSYCEVGFFSAFRGSTTISA